MFVFERGISRLGESPLLLPTCLDVGYVLLLPLARGRLIPWRDRDCCRS